MENVIVILLVVGIVGLLWMLLMVMRQIREICRQLSYIEKEDTNRFITVQIRGFGIGKMVNHMNDILLKERNRRKVYMEKEERIQQVYTNLSHDIRTPLTSMDGYVQLLEQVKDEEKQKKYLGIIRERIESLKEILEELFTFTKLKDPDYELALRELSVNRLLKQTIFSYYDNWQVRGIEPQLEIAEEEFQILGNETALKRTFQNIIKNALLHGKSDIFIGLRKEGKQVVVLFENSISDDRQIDAEQVFERFYKGDASRTHTSTGLGLSIAKEFVELMQGEISARVEDGRFGIEIRFPVESNMPTFYHSL